jgi:hypothetical protein
MVPAIADMLKTAGHDFEAVERRARTRDFRSIDLKANALG